MSRAVLTAALVSFLLVTSGCNRGDKGRDAPSPQKTYRIAILLPSDTYLPLSAAGLQEGMRELGYQQGTNIEYAIYNAGGDPAKLAALAKELLASRPDVICPSTVSAVKAVFETGTTLPVVFLESMYPVEFGLVKSLTEPGTNFTGVTNMTGPMSGKRLELLVRLVPGIRRVALIYNPENEVARLAMETTREAAGRLGVQLDLHPVHRPEEVDVAIAAVEAGRDDALVLNPDFMVFSRLGRIVAMARKKKIPTMGIDASQAEQGILASYGGGLKEIARQAARQVDRVLKGEVPAVIPVQPPRRYQLFVNLKTAEAIGVSLPEEFLHQAAGYYR